MTAALALDCAANADWDATFTVANADGTPRAIGGAQALMQVRRQEGDTTVALDLSTDNGRLAIPDDQTGVIVLHVPYADLAQMAGAYVYDLLLASDGHRQRPFAGTLTVTPGVTRWPPAAA